MIDREPTLVIMAAGMGSRFGGLKQMTPVDEEGHFIIDFSLYDAYRAGFRRVAFIIKREIEQTFRKTIGARMEKWFHVDYVYQELDRLPEGFAVPEGRKKPWGTAHAVACCRGVVEGPFAVINSDDFYGRGAYEEIYRFLTENDASFRDVPLQEAIQRIFDEKGMSKAQLAKQSGISEVYLHQLFSGRRFPSRSRLLCLCFGLGATVDEAQSLLQQARHAPLYSRDRRDAIIIFALSHHMTLFEVNDKLFTENLDTLC